MPKKIIAMADDLLGQVFAALITAGILYIASSINTLNQRMAVVVEQLIAHEHRIEMLEQGKKSDQK